MEPSSSQQLSLAPLLWVILFGSAFVIQASNEEPASSTEILDANVSYIIEPFEKIEGNSWTFSDPSIANISSDSLYGNGAILFRMESSTNEEYYEASWVSERHPHNCFGASELSIAVKTEKSMSIEVSILDDRECLFVQRQFDASAAASHCSDSSNLTSFPIFGLQELESSSDWQELSISIAELQEQSDILDLKRIRGWKIRMLNATGQVFVDQLACRGGGSLLGAAFHVLTIANETFDQIREDGMWLETFFESELAANSSTNHLEDSVMQMDYLVQKSFSWGGFNDVVHLAAGNGYYNLSQANGIVLYYNILRPASIPERCIFRFILQDGSHCVEDCDSEYRKHERWYSFNSIMDLQGIGNMTLPLDGSTGASSTFRYTGWSGIKGNKILDAAYIKGFTLEVVLDSGLELYEHVEGSFEISNMTAVKLPETDKESVGVLENLLYFHEGAGDEFTRIEFMGARCCEVCEEDPDCLFAMSNNRDCFIASQIDYKYVGLLATETTTQSYWMDAPIKRGNWCDKCICDEYTRTIDCQGKHLKILPKTINVGWEPRIIDLQNNPQLIMIGSGSFVEVANALEEIRLPNDVKFLSPGALDTLPKLQNIVFEGDEGSIHRIINIITSEEDSFGEVCCGFGFTTEINSDLKITQCDMKIDAPGIDSVYDNFYSYSDATVLRVVTEDSNFMREAAESVEKCAEFCSIDDDCNYFTYDQRFPNAEHRCHMYQNNGTLYSYSCCLDDHFADEERTIPGIISGRPPQSRNRDENAGVIISTSELSLVESNNFATSLTLSLGATPLRGAVWVSPKITTGSTELHFVAEPSQVALYTANSTAEIYISLARVPKPGSQLTTVLVELDVIEGE